MTTDEHEAHYIPIWPFRLSSECLEASRGESVPAPAFVWGCWIFFCLFLMRSLWGSLELDLWPWCSACWDWGDGVYLCSNVVSGEALKRSCVTEAVHGLSHNLDSQWGVDEGSSCNDTETGLYNSLKRSATCFIPPGCWSHTEGGKTFTKMSIQPNSDPNFKYYLHSLYMNFRLIEFDYIIDLGRNVTKS